MSTNAPPVDPITQVYRKVRQTLLDRFVAVPDPDTGKPMVRPGNVPDLSDRSFQTFKRQVQPGDLPEVVVVQGAFALQPFGVNSLVSTVRQTFPVIDTFDRMTVTQGNVLKFHALIALLQAGDDLGLRGLVRSWEITGGADDVFGKPDWTRETERLTSVFSVTVQLDLSRRQLLAM